MDQPAGSLKVGTCLAHGPTSHLKAGRLRLRYAYDVDQFGSVRAGTCLAHEPTSPLKAGRLRVKTCLAHGPSSPLKAGRLRVKSYERTETWQSVSRMSVIGRPDSAFHLRQCLQSKGLGMVLISHSFFNTPMQRGSVGPASDRCPPVDCNASRIVGQQQHEKAFLP